MQNLKQAHRAKKLAYRRPTDQEASVMRPSIGGNLMAAYDDMDVDDQQPGEDYFAKLSDELVLQIFRRLPVVALTRYNVVCKRWHRLMQDGSLWKRFDLSNGIIMSDVLIKFLNRGVRLLGLCRSEVRKSEKKRLNGGMVKTIADQFEFHLNRTLLVECLDLTNSTIDLNALNAILKRTKFLRKISLEGLTINSDTLKYLAQNVQLRTLNLSLCVGVDMQGLVYLLDSLKNLSELNLSWTLLYHEEVAYVCQNLPSTLIELDLSGCRNTLLDPDIEKLVLSCPNLLELDISDAMLITDQSVTWISKHLSQLIFLGLSRCYKLSTAAFQTIGNLKCLQVLNAFNVLKTMTTFKPLKKRVPSLVALNQYPFSAIARPITTQQTKRIWGRVLDQKPIVKS